MRPSDCIQSRNVPLTIKTLLALALTVAAPIAAIAGFHLSAKKSAIAIQIDCNLRCHFHHTADHHRGLEQPLEGLGSNSHRYY